MLMIITAWGINGDLLEFQQCSLVAKGFYAEKIGTKINLVPLDAEFSAEQHVQNPLKSPLGNLLNIYFNFLLSNIK